MELRNRVLPTPSITVVMTQAVSHAVWGAIRKQREASTFSGIDNAAVVEWIDLYERESQHNGWEGDMKVTNVVFYLTDEAKTWFINHEPDFSSWDILKTRMLEMFGRPAARKLLAERKLAMRVQIPDENYTSYLEDVFALRTRVDKEMAESEKTQHILKGINEHAFNVLLMLNPASIQEIATECQRIQECRNRRVAFGHQTDRLPDIRSNEHSGELEL